MTNFRKSMSDIKAFIFDVDGVLGSDKVWLHPNGEMLRTMNIKDGYAMQYAIRMGYKIAVISGGNSDSVKNRFVKLGIEDVYMQSQHKLEEYSQFKKKYSLTDNEILYMGDDIPDYEVMLLVGLPTCPASAVEEIKAISKYISDKPGGEGAVRDIIQQVMRLQGKWMDKESMNW
jgi:3-deoxy-D-manno-octulosonate 8-phosphate phosphatase (KDO 8-P phosphatase)